MIDLELGVGVGSVKEFVRLFSNVASSTTGEVSSSAESFVMVTVTNSVCVALERCRGLGVAWAIADIWRACGATVVESKMYASVLAAGAVRRVEVLRLFSGQYERGDSCKVRRWAWR
jgi:hypothetical protein